MSVRERNRWINACYERYYDILIVRVRAYIGNEAVLRNEVEDYVLEAFEIAWEKYDTIKDHPSILGWLTKAAYNRVDNKRQLASVRMEKTAVRLDSDMPFEIEDTQALRRLEMWHEKEANQKKINQILEMLSSNEKEIFEDYFVRGKRAKTIQAERGMTLEGVRATIRRIRKKARSKKFPIWLIFLSTVSYIYQIKK